MRRYVVVYVVCGMHYRYRCYAENVRQAKKSCIESMLIARKDIYDVYEEEWYK